VSSNAPWKQCTRKILVLEKIVKIDQVVNTFHNNFRSECLTKKSYG
jgi:hypothetical protein